MKKKISAIFTMMFESLSLSIWESESRCDIEQLTYHPNTFVFIDNDSSKSKYDHVYIVVENLEYKDTGDKVQ